MLPLNGGLIAAINRAVRDLNSANRAVESRGIPARQSGNPGKSPRPGTVSQKPEIFALSNVIRFSYLHSGICPTRVFQPFIDGVSFVLRPPLPFVSHPLNYITCNCFICSPLFCDYSCLLSYILLFNAPRSLVYFWLVRAVDVRNKSRS